MNTNMNCELKIYTDIKSLFIESLKYLESMPRVEQHSVVPKIKTEFIDYLCNIRQSHSIKAKSIHYANLAEANLDNLKTLFKLTNRLRYISHKVYRDTSEKLSIASIELIGYIKNIKNKGAVIA